MPKAKPKKPGPKAARTKLDMTFQQAVQTAVRTPKQPKTQKPGTN